MSVVRIPEDFMKALEADAYLQDYFMGLSASHKREYVRWIDEAQREDTRLRRIQKAIQMLREKQQHVGADDV